MYSPEVLKEMRELCAEHEVLFIADEVMTGFGRTGTMFACEQAGVVPDLMCLSKGAVAQGVEEDRLVIDVRVVALGDIGLAVEHGEARRRKGRPHYVHHRGEDGRVSAIERDGVGDDHLHSGVNLFVTNAWASRIVPRPVAVSALVIAATMMATIAWLATSSGADSMGKTRRIPISAAATVIAESAKGAAVT